MRPTLDINQNNLEGSDIFSGRQQTGVFYDRLQTVQWQHC